MYMAAERAKTTGACKSVDKPFKRRNETRLRRSFAPQKFQASCCRMNRYALLIVPLMRHAFPSPAIRSDYED